MKTVYPILFLILLNRLCLGGEIPKINGFKKDIYLGVYGGINFSLPIIVNGFTILSQAGDASPGAKTYGNYLQNPGFHAGVAGYLQWSDHVALNVWPGYSRYKFSYTVFNNWADGTSIQNSSYQFTNRYQSLSIPISIYYIFRPDHKLFFYVSGGFHYEFILGSSKQLNYHEEMINQGVTTGIFNQSIRYDRIRMMIRNHIQAQAGLGLGYHFNRYMVLLESNFRSSPINIMRQKVRYNDQSTLFTYPDIQDNIRMNNLNIQIAIFYNIHQAPKKLKCVTP